MMLEDLLKDDLVRAEYHKSFLLNLFQKICSKMDKDEKFRFHLRKVYRESFDKAETTRNVVKKYLNYELAEDDSTCMLEWFEANFHKLPRRKPISNEIKETLVKKQNNRCAVCGEPFDSDSSRIHVDHIIPWKLVGDELKDNFQALCETCNECKSAKTDYIFKSLMKLV